MDEQLVKVTVYGADRICPSCINSPGSRETYEWLQAAISRKYGNPTIQYRYIDIFQPPEDKEQQEFVQRVFNEDLFYPVVLVNEEIVGEGNPRLKSVYQALEAQGIR